MKKLLAIGAALLITTPSLAAHKAKHYTDPFKPGTYLPGAPPVFTLPNGRTMYIGQEGKVVDMKKDKCFDRFYPYRAPGWC